MSLISKSDIIFNRTNGLSNSYNLNSQPPSSIAYVSSNFQNGPAGITNTGLSMTVGSSAWDNDVTNERAFQMYFGDTPTSGLYSRVKQGTAGWHPWVKHSNDFAYKEGPTSWASAYKANWNNGGGRGNLDWSSYSDGIVISESGYYYCYAYQRCPTNGDMIGISINGDRATLEARSDNIWGHDHNGATGGSWSKSICVGWLESGWRMSSGTPASTQGSYGTGGYNGGLVIWRIS